LLARLTRARRLLLLLLARLLTAALLLTTLTRLISLLLLARFLVGLLVLVHLFSFQRWLPTPRPNCKTNARACEKFHMAAGTNSRVRVVAKRRCQTN
jgi:hypothetical protein